MDDAHKSHQDSLPSPENFNQILNRDEVSLSANVSDKGQVQIERLQGDLKIAFEKANTLNELALSWLKLFAVEVSSFDFGIVMLKAENQDVLLPIAIWPEIQGDNAGLTRLVQSAVKQNRVLHSRIPGIIPGQNIVHLAMPISLEHTLYGAVAIALRNDDPPFSRLALALLKWGIAWLTQFIWRDAYLKNNHASEQASFVTDTLMLVAEKEQFQEVLLVLVNHLATRLQLQRVSLGWIQNTKVQVRALSHAAHFQKSHESMQRLLQAMEEAYDQSRHIVLPYPEGKVDLAQSRLITSDHQQLLLADTVGAVASFLIQSPGKVIGVLTFEYPLEHKPSQEDVLLGDLLGSALAPLLTEKSRADRWLGGKFDAKLKKLKSMLLGDEHPVYKLAAVSLLLVAALLFLVQADFRITAKTVIEGLVQRAAVAPFDGFIAQAPVRAGDHVKAGQLVAGLDNRDLLLEKARLDSEVAQNVRKYREALVKHDRAVASVSAAQLDQAEAELALVTEKLQRADIKAPFDGIVVSGDLSQKLGAPVEQGNVLFEITPLDAYRIILKVDERDISYIQPGQTGLMTLTGLTNDKLAFNVKKVTPVAVAEDGMNYFRVEAELVGEKPILRPGMEGVGKILVGEDSIWRIWTRRFFDWLSISLWTWMP
jgi:biotin carboxyl carrier protein